MCKEKLERDWLELHREEQTKDDRVPDGAPLLEDFLDQEKFAAVMERIDTKVRAC